MIHRTDEAQCALFEETPPSSGGTKRRRPAGGAPKPADFGLTAPSQVVKNYVLDTNVLLHDPASLERFKENHLCIPVDVLAELDKFKSEQTERGANARRVHRRLTEMFSSAGSGHARGHHRRRRNRAPGHLRSGDAARKTRISSTASIGSSPTVSGWITGSSPPACCSCSTTRHPVVLVTKDINMQLKARAVGIECQDYLNDKVDAREVSNYEVRRIEVDPNELQRFASAGDLTLEDGRIAWRGGERICPVRSGRQTNHPGPARGGRPLGAPQSPGSAEDPRRPGAQAAQSRPALPDRRAAQPGHLAGHLLRPRRHRQDPGRGGRRAP